MADLKTLLARSAERHDHLCPRQVLGVRMGLAGAGMLGLAVPNATKALLVILETDGCFADGIEVATGCSIGHRTLRVEDYGKVAATFIHTASGRALRLVPDGEVRQRAQRFAAQETRRYYAQLIAYQELPDDQLFHTQEVRLSTSVEAILSRAGARARCAHCGEEILNEREIERDGDMLCVACGGQAYYQLAASVPEARLPIELERV